MHDSLGDDSEGPAYPITSVDRALRLVRLLSTEPDRDLRIQEVADFLNVAPSTAHRFLRMLVHHQFAEQDSAGKTYRAGPAVGSTTRSRTHDLALARPILEDLRDRVKETVHLTTLEGGYAVTLLSVESRQFLRVGDRAGQANPAYATAMGNALLFGFSERDLFELYPSGIEDNRLGVTSLKALAQRLRVAEEVGYASVASVVLPDVSAIAVPVTTSIPVKYAIGITYPKGRLSPVEETKSASSARRAAAALSAMLNT